MHLVAKMEDNLRSRVQAPLHVLQLQRSGLLYTSEVADLDIVSISGADGCSDDSADGAGPASMGLGQ